MAVANQQTNLPEYCPIYRRAGTGNAYALRARVTAAEVNAGKTLVAPPAGRSLRMIDCLLIAIGGNAGGATTVDVVSGATKLVAAAVAGLTRSAVVRAGDASGAVLADGASFAALAAGAIIGIAKTGNDLTGATHVDVLLTYAIE